MNRTTSFDFTISSMRLLASLISMLLNLGVAVVSWSACSTPPIRPPSAS
jgi:hypothetical protein